MTEATIGHNSGGITGERLRSFIQRAERLNVDKENIAEDLKKLFSEARSAGFDVRAIKEVIKIRKMDKADRQERDELVRVYLDAVGE